jgi:8-oxo-dGTP pyrophosphatase MutT (NUDIX family)
MSSNSQSQCQLDRFNWATVPLSPESLSSLPGLVEDIRANKKARGLKLKMTAVQFHSNRDVLRKVFDENKGTQFRVQDKRDTNTYYMAFANGKWDLPTAFPCGTGAHAVPTDSKGQVILMHAGKDKSGTSRWSGPGGSGDSTETFRQIAFRETAEELNAPVSELCKHFRLLQVNQYHEKGDEKKASDLHTTCLLRTDGVFRQVKPNHIVLEDGDGKQLLSFQPGQETQAIGLFTWSDVKNTMMSIYEKKQKPNSVFRNPTAMLLGMGIANIVGPAEWCVKQNEAYTRVDLAPTGVDSDVTKEFLRYFNYK